MRDETSIMDVLRYIARRMEDIENCGKVVDKKQDDKFLILKKRYDELAKQMEIVDSIYYEYAMYIQDLTTKIISEEKTITSNTEI
ncbi:hypothetical protein [Proteiniborus sp. MB09-C3]|uniref:hypothetical protein n=1 Tax=Proteiniborus sp. MB09-C3 TaxID=3050072 RepID=UPI0025525B43|nr:hypothetical protein [Proteiniborus sp. MB09-C3]WIV13239.1 hypothetical protein QO263_05890 [Proteiniborus sp. MB09-C3]